MEKRAWYCCNGCFHHQIKQILLETFIKVLDDKLNKLEHKDNAKIEDIDKISDNLPESEAISIEN